MKYSLSIGLILCFSVATAQLNVDNNAFVFVKDQVLFVNDNVNLKQPESKIYLREEAQLIQGTGTTGNSGVGELSVYQEGTTNQWEYNYWCSPVGGFLSDTYTNNAFRVNQLHEPLNLIDSDASSPTTSYDGTASPMQIATRWLWTFISSNQYSQWIPVDFENGDINPGLGFTMKGTGESPNFGDTRYDFRGKPNNGDISNPVAENQFTLIGNPYPSAMDIREFLWDPTNLAAINGTIYYWDQDTSTPERRTHILQDYVGGYHEFTINENGTLPTLAAATFFTFDEEDGEFPLPGLGESGTKTAKRYIPIGQGFMVKGREGTTGTVITKNSYRTYEKEGSESFFFRSIDQSTTTPNTNEPSTTPNALIIQYLDNGLVAVPLDYKRFRINVDFTVNQSQYTRQVILNFNDSATSGFDYGLELSRSSNYPSDTYFTSDDKAYSAQAYPFTEDLIIPLVVDIEQQQPLRFRIFDIQNFEDTQGIYIHDLENDTYVNLRNQNYELNIAPGHYTERFEIVFTTESALSLADLEAQTLNIRQNNSSNLLVVSNPKNLELQTIAVYDITGKRLLLQNYKSISNRYELSTSDLSDGVYVVNVLSNTNSKIKSQKIIVTN